MSATQTATDPSVDSLAPLTKSVEEISKRLDNVATNDALSPLQKELKDLRAEYKRIQDELKALQPKNITLPAEARRQSRLNAFKTEEAAYLFGMGCLAKVHIERPEYRSPMTAKAVKFLRDKGLLNLDLAMNTKDMDEAEITKATNQVEGVNTQGGFLVFDQISSEIIDLREMYGMFRPNARVLPLTGDRLLMNRRTGGLTGYWVGEVGSLTVSNKTWDQISLVPKKRAYLTRWSTELNEDAVINLADDLANEMAYELATIEDQCGFIGDGTSTYAGMRGVAWKFETENTSLAGLYSAASSHTAFETLTLTDAHGTIGKLPQYALGNAKWYTSAYGFAAGMQRLMYAGGGNTVTTISGGSGYAFLGFPVVISQVLNSTAGADASKVKALFGDLRRAALMGVRRELQIQTSTERYFDTDELAIRGTARFDINVHDVGNNTTPGPIVALRTAAS